MSRLLATLVAVAVLWSAATVHADRIEVRVVEIAGKRAYLSAGTSKGLFAGTQVDFGKFEARVEQSSHSYAVVSARKLRVGFRGVADVRRAVTGEKSEKLPPPRPLSAFESVWPEAELPATKQTPKPVPLGRFQGSERRVEATLSAMGASFIPLEGDYGAVGRGELRARLIAPLSANYPITFQGDVAVQRWFGRYTTGVASGDPRPLMRVREAALVMGRPDSYAAQLGRLRYAAANLGPIDGARVEAARWGVLKMAGFGGLLPDPISGQLALNGAGRFGLEFDALGEELASRPELTVVMQGSVFDGKLDERRLFAQGQLWPGQHRLSAYGELSAFDKNNPWHRPTSDITAAGADMEFRFDALHVGARFDMRKPERSYWLQHSFPSTWLCSTSSALDPTVPCTKADDTRYVVQGFGGYGGKVAALDAGASWAGSSQQDLGHHAIGYGTLRFPRVGDRFDLALGGTQEGGSLVAQSTSVRGDVGVGWLDERVRLGLYYRPLYRRYRASVEGLWEQGAGATLHVAPLPVLAFDLYGDLRVGDVDAMLVMFSMLYRVAP
jgi:hypothetical protein